MDKKSPESCELDIDLNSFSAEESEHILHVIHQDFLLRYWEKDRLWDIESLLLEEDLKTRILAQHYEFNQKTCMRCFSRFLILFNKKLCCCHCGFYICKNCCEFDEVEKKHMCKVCVKQKELRKQSSEWFYSSVCKKFERCGSAKVIWHFYKQRLPQSTTASGSSAVGDWLQLINAEHDTGTWLHSIDKEIQENVDSSAEQCTNTAINRPMDLLLHRRSASGVCDFLNNDQNQVGNSELLCAKDADGFIRETDPEPDLCANTTHLLPEDGSKFLLETDVLSASVQTDNCDNQLVKLAEEIVAAQGKTSYLAEKMFDSANLIQLMTAKLDEMDESLHGLETHLSGLGHDTDAMTESCQQVSLEVMSGLTSTAFELLSSAKDALLDDSNNLKPVHKLKDFEKTTVSEALSSTLTPLKTQTDNDGCNVMELSEELFKSIEKQIYVTSSEVFMLEEHVNELQTKVLATDECSSVEQITGLENEIALTVAKVANTSVEVSNIEQQVKTMLEHTQAAYK